MFVTACSTDEYAEEKRTENNSIVRSSISEAETTNNKICIRRFVLKLYIHEASRGLFATAELLVFTCANPTGNTADVHMSPMWHVKGMLGDNSHNWHCN